MQFHTEEETPKEKNAVIEDPQEQSFVKKYVFKLLINCK